MVPSWCAPATMVACERQFQGEHSPAAEPTPRRNLQRRMSWQAPCEGSGGGGRSRRGRFVMGLSPTTIIWVAIILLTLLFWMYCDINNSDRI